MDNSASQLGLPLWAQICLQVFCSVVSLTNTEFPQQPVPPDGVLPLQAAAAAMCRDCHAKSYAEYLS